MGIDAKGIFPFLQIFPLRVAEICAYYASTTSAMRKSINVAATGGGVGKAKATAGEGLELQAAQP